MSQLIIESGENLEPATFDWTVSKASKAKFTVYEKRKEILRQGV